MHDPMTVAHEIFLGKQKKKNGHYRTPFITIWHVDPEKDGTDDSCGWFMRARHGDKEMLKKIRSAIESDFDRTFVSDSSGTLYLTGYFTPISGAPVMSVHGIALSMFSAAAWQYFKYDRAKQRKWMNKHLFEILHFAENPTDSLKDEIIGTFRRGTNTPWSREGSLDHYASIIYAWILRSERPWWKHPKWHIHHWKITFPIFRSFYRRYFQKCSMCGKIGFGNSSAYSDWDRTKVWCEKCNQKTMKPSPSPQC